MERVGRRLLVTAAFAIMLTVQVLAGQLVDGRGVASMVVGGIFALGLVLGFLKWPFFENAAQKMGALTMRERVRLAVMSMGTVGAVVLIGQTLVAGSIDRGDVVRVGLVLGVLFAFVALLPRLVGTPQRRQGSSTVVLPRSLRGSDRA